MEHKDIHEALLAIYEEVGYVQKERAQNLNYTFASEKAFIQSLRPAMINHGVTVSVRKMDDLRQEGYSTKTGTAMVRSTVHGEVWFTHVSGSALAVESYGEGSDSGDKSVNKAMTDMYKYALRQTFMIETGDDPDTTPSYVSEKKSVVESAQALGGVSKNDKPSSTMTVDFAKSIVGGDGKKYGDCTPAELEGKKIGLMKLKKSGKIDETNQLKLDAVLTLLGN